jgi:hypothetical protein
MKIIMSITKINGNTYHSLRVYSVVADFVAPPRVLPCALWLLLDELGARLRHHSWVFGRAEAWRDVVVCCRVGLGWWEVGSS